MADQIAFAGPMPRVGMAFIPGYYFWSESQWVWINPTWAAPPVAGAVWVEPNWVEDNGAWDLQEGYWQESSGAASQESAVQDNPEPQESETQEQRERSMSIANGQLVFNPLRYTWYRFVIPDGVSGAHVVGDFRANNAAGVGVVINDGKQKGRKTTTFWRTPTQQTSGTLDVPLNPGVYFLVFSDSSGSGFANFMLNVNVSLNYQQ